LENDKTYQLDICLICS